MLRVLSINFNAKKAISAMVIVSVFAVTSAFAQSGVHMYPTEMVVSEGKKSVQTDADLTMSETSFKVVPDKASFASEAKEMTYAEIKAADYSYSKKPMLSGGGAIATALLVGFIFALPFLFIKKKNHWLTIQGDNKFVVLKLGGDNFRQIRADFEAHGVKVNTVEEEKKK